MNARLEQNQVGDWLLSGHLLHPASAPLEAAARDVSAVLSQARPDDLLVLAGLGLGWHAKAINDAPGHPKLIAFEPDADIRERQAAVGPGLGGVQIATDLHQLSEMISGHVVYARTDRVALFSPRAYRNTFPTLLKSLQELIRQIVDRRASDLLARRTNNLRWAHWAMCNLGHVLATPDVAATAGAFKGVPAFVVGAGPSLNQTLSVLSSASKKGLLLCAASALGPLSTARITPHCAIAIEAKDESRQFLGRNINALTLIAASSSHPNHFETWPGPLAHVHLLPWLARICASLALPNGGHATSLAFTMAYFWGCDPIILVGQDLAYTGGRVHAQGRPGGEEDGVQAGLHTAAIGGGEVQTSQVFSSYINWYQESASHIARSASRRRIINCTSAGALIPGFEHLPLEKICGALRDAAPSARHFNAVLASAKQAQKDTVLRGLATTKDELQASLCRLQNGESVKPEKRDDSSILAYAIDAASGDMKHLAEILKLLLEYIDDALENNRV